MERGRNERDDFFGAGDPFAAGFDGGGFGRRGSSIPSLFGGRDPFAAGFGGGGFGRRGSSIPSLFGGRDPFDDPFFAQPFGGRMGGPGMFGHSLFGQMGVPGMFGHSLFGPMDAPTLGDGFLEQAPARSNGKRPIITEIDDEEAENAERANEQPNHESYVQEPDDRNDGMQGGQVQLRRDLNRANSSQPQARTFTYQSSSVTHGGVNGAYYTASKTRRSGSDGKARRQIQQLKRPLIESPEEFMTRGHSLTRKLKSDGKVDSTQILHNLNEDELPGFEESWKGNAGQHVGWNQNAGISNDDNSGNHGANGRGQRSARSWALPATEQARDMRRRDGRPKSRVIPIS